MVWKHFKVGDRTVKWLLERGQFVHLDEKVADPGPTVAMDHAEDQQLQFGWPWAAATEYLEQDHAHVEGADEVKQLGDGIGVLAKVEGIELFEALKLNSTTCQLFALSWNMYYSYVIGTLHFVKPDNYKKLHSFNKVN